MASANARYVRYLLIAFFVRGSNIPDPFNAKGKRHDDACTIGEMLTWMQRRF